MTSQLVIFRAFLFIFFRPPDPKSEKKNPVNQLIKKFWPKAKPTNYYNQETCDLYISDLYIILST